MKKRHHFVPQFYLRRFAAHEPNEEIWTYDMQTGEVRGSSVENTAFEKYLYSVTLEDGSRTDDLENLIADIEGRAAPVLDHVLAGENIEGQERADFASFLALMHVRTDAYRLQFAQAMTSFMQLEAYVTAGHEEAFQSLIERFQRDVRPMSDEEIKQARQAMRNPQDFRVSVDKGWTLAALGFHEELTAILHGMTWTVMRAGAPRYFITGANPLVYGVPQHLRDPFYGGDGLCHEHVEVTMPLSTDSCLLATWKKDKPRLGLAPAEAVKDLNRVRAYYASRFLFGCKRDAGIEKLAQKYKGTKPGWRMSGFGPDEYSPVQLKRSRKQPTRKASRRRRS